eukprot:5143559-Pleurochrysis_carterae.AAC.4
MEAAIYSETDNVKARAPCPLSLGLQHSEPCGGEGRHMSDSALAAFRAQEKRNCSRALPKLPPTPLEKALQRTARNSGFYVDG